MKRLRNLGKALSREEQKKILGGYTLVCTCNDRYTMGIVCSYSGFGGMMTCQGNAARACVSAGGTNLTCSYPK